MTDENGFRRVEVDEPAAAIVLRINHDYAAGMSPVQIATALTAEGLPSPEGKPVWSPSTILGTKRSGNGLLRNPFYVGHNIFGKTKVRLESKTGKFIKTKAATEDMVHNDAPWLRILPDELWRQVQDILNERTFTPARLNRRPDYLLSGLTKCGMCGGAFALTTARLGCANHRVKACDNPRRVVREDLERVVLEGLRGRIAQANIIDWFLPEYLQKAERAAQENAGREALQRARREEVDREIENVLKQVRAGAAGYAAKLINGNLESLGLEQERLTRELRAAKPAPPPPLSTEAAVEKLHALLDNLGVALQGDERDATRARDIIRAFIQRIVVMPIASEGRQDGRGCGLVRVTVERAISTLVDQALANGKTLHSRSAEAVQGLPTLTFRYYVDLDRRLSDQQEGVYADQAVLARLLEEADLPAHYRDLVAALNDLGREPTPAEIALLERRADFAMRSLRRNEWVRSVGQGAEARWVWEGRGLSDEAWLDRLRHPEAFTPPVGIVGISPPEAYVVVIGPGSQDPAQPSSGKPAERGAQHIPARQDPTPLKSKRVTGQRRGRH